MSFIDFATERGLIIDHIVSGRWARVPTVDHPHKRNGAYWYGGEFGHCQNWACMDQVDTWQDKKPRTSFEQADMQKRIEASRKQYAQQRAQGQHKAAEKAKWILSQCELDRHGYLEKKGFQKLKGNVWKHEGQDPLLAVPMYYMGHVCGCQLIGSTGEKKFLTGQRTNDAFFQIGNGKRAFIVEGYASALSAHAILAAAKIPATIYAAFSVGNASRLAKTHPAAFWIADNDHSGVGQAAAANSGLNWWMPPDVGQDVNDWHQQVGLLSAMLCLTKVLR